jgi:hypothetical protein
MFRKLTSVREASTRWRDKQQLQYVRDRRLALECAFERPCVELLSVD